MSLDPVGHPLGGPAYLVKFGELVHAFVNIASVEPEPEVEPEQPEPSSPSPSEHDH